MSEVLGGFEHQVLLAIMRLGGESYSVPVVLEIEERTGRTVAPAAVYVTLRRLERRNLLESQVAPPEPGRTGRPHRLFKVTPAGVDLLRESKRSFVSLWEGISLLEESGT